MKIEQRNPCNLKKMPNIGLFGIIYAHIATDLCLSCLKLLG